MNIKCYVKQNNGRYKKYNSKDGNDFKDRDGFTYKGPVAANHEILEEKSIFGDKSSAFYVKGHKQAIPLSKKGIWHTTEDEDDKALLVAITRDALLEVRGAELKATAQLGGIALIILLELINLVW